MQVIHNLEVVGTFPSVVADKPSLVGKIPFSSHQKHSSYASLSQSITLRHSVGFL